MKKSQLRQLIREEIRSVKKEELLPTGARAVEFVIVDADDPYSDKPLFTGTLNDVRNQLLLMLRGGELPGLDIMEKRDWEEIRNDSAIENDDIDIIQEWGRREIDDEYDDFEYSDSEKEYGYSIGKDPEFFTDNDWDDFRQYEEDVKNNIRDSVPNREMGRIKAGGYRGRK